MALFNEYNEQESIREKAVLQKSTFFAHDVVNIAPGDCFMLPIRDVRDGSSEQGNVLISKYVMIADISNAGVDCLVIDIEGVSTGSGVIWQKVTQHREVYPSFTDVLWNDCAINVTDARHLQEDTLAIVQDMIRQATPQTKRGGSVDTGIDAFVYTGNNIDIASHFGETTEDPEEDPSGGQSDEPKEDPLPTDNPSNER